MNKIRISSYQIFVLMVLFQFGSASVVALGMESKQDAWISTLLASVFGLVIFQVYVYLYKAYPNLILTEYVKEVLGKTLGLIIAMLYILYFLYVGILIIRDTGDLLFRTSFDATPLFVISGLIMGLVGYSLIKGFEVIARAGEIFFIFTMFTILFLILLIFLSGIVDFSNLKPILEKGWNPVFRSAFPVTYTIQFGEAIVFTMFLPLVHPNVKGTQSAIIGIIVSGILLLAITMIDISVLGAQRAVYEAFPTLATIAEINVANFIQRLDSLALSLLVVGAFFKITLFHLAAIHGLQGLFRIKNHKSNSILILVVCIITPLIATTMADSTYEYLKIGVQIVVKYVHIPMQLILPIIFMGITFVKKRKKLDKKSL